MIRGETTFICTQCKNKFTAMDIEYHCMALSCPMPCPHCGSIRTLPLHKLQEWTSPLEKNIGEIIETDDEKNVRFYPFTKGYGEKWKEKKVKNDNNSTADFAIPQLMLRVQKTQRIIKSERDDNKKKGKEF